MSDNLNLAERLRPVPRSGLFKQEGYCVWCGSLLKYGDEYYLYYSRWPEEIGFKCWCTDCEIAVARSNELFGEFTFDRVVLKGEHDGSWDESCVHNPQVLEYKGKFYIFHMGNNGHGNPDIREDWLNYNRRQRVGCAVADHPLGPFRHCSEPVVDISENGIDSLITSNPAAAIAPDGSIHMIYKAVSRSDDTSVSFPHAVICGAATAENPMGPYKKHGKPIMLNPNNRWSVEDPTIWHNGERWYAVVKDFQGYFSGVKPEKGYTLALMTSEDGFDWRPAANPFVSDLTLIWEDGEHELLCNKERPQIFIENGELRALVCACARYPGYGDSFSLRIPIE